MKKIPLNQDGQVVLTIVVFMVVMILITTAATLITVVNTRSTFIFEQGVKTYNLAETGAENALIQLLRNSNYSGETLSLNGGTVVTTVSVNGSGKRILSTATLGNFTRKIQVDVSYNNNILVVNSWTELF